MGRLSGVRRHIGRRGMVALPLAIALLAVTASVAMAATYSVAPQAIGSMGFFMPYHNITRVYVHDLGGFGACEDAWNNGWVQDHHICVYGGATYHDFCGCITRQGWIASATPGASEYMDGHEDY